MTDTLIPEGFRELDVPDSFVGLIGPLWFKAEGEKLRVGLPLEPRHGNPMGWAHGGLLVTVADMVMGVGSGHATGIRWPHPTVSLSTEFVRGAKLGQWLEGTARVAGHGEPAVGRPASRGGGAGCGAARPHRGALPPGGPARGRLLSLDARRGRARPARAQGT